MKIDKPIDAAQLMKVIDTCTGRVELITGEGDRLNLKSKLCQIISIASIFPSVAELPNLEIIAHEPEDMEKIAKFLFQ